MCKLPFRKHASSKAPSNWKKRKFFSFCGIHGARREDTEGGDQEAIPPAPPGRISHRDSKKPERVIVKGEEDCSQPIICEAGVVRAAESSEILLSPWIPHTRSHAPIARARPPLCRLWMMPAVCWPECSGKSTALRSLPFEISAA
jgi:hypothetical protein